MDLNDDSIQIPDVKWPCIFSKICKLKLKYLALNKINNEKYIVSGNAEELDKYLGNKVIISKIGRDKCKINPLLDDKNREDTKDKDIKNDKK